MCDETATLDAGHAWRSLASALTAEGYAEEIVRPVALGSAELAQWGNSIGWSDLVKIDDDDRRRTLLLLEVDDVTAGRVAEGGQIIVSAAIVAALVEGAWSSGHREGVEDGRREAGRRPHLQLVNGSTASAESTVFVAGNRLRLSVKGGQPFVSEHDRVAVADKLRHQSRALGQCLAIATDPYGHTAGVASLEDAPGIDDRAESFADVVVAVSSLAAERVAVEGRMAERVADERAAKDDALHSVAELLQVLGLLTGKPISTDPTPESVEAAREAAADWGHTLANKVGAVAGAAEIISEDFADARRRGVFYQPSDVVVAGLGDEAKELVRLVRGFRGADEVSNG